MDEVERCGNLDAAQITDRQWDAVIIGTGMGGATIWLRFGARWLAGAVLRKGNSSIAANSETLRESMQRSFFLNRPLRTKRVEVLRRAGRYFEEVSDMSYRAPSRFVPF